MHRCYSPFILTPNCCVRAARPRPRAFSTCMQDHEIGDMLANLHVCIVCLNNTVSKVVEAVLRRTALSCTAEEGASCSLARQTEDPLKLRVSSRLLGGGNPIWHHAGSWQNVGLEGDCVDCAHLCQRSRLQTCRVIDARKHTFDVISSKVHLAFIGCVSIIRR